MDCVWPLLLCTAYLTWSLSVIFEPITAKCLTFMNFLLGTTVVIISRNSQETEVFGTEQGTVIRSVRSWTLVEFPALVTLDMLGISLIPLNVLVKIRAHDGHA